MTESNDPTTKPKKGRPEGPPPTPFDHPLFLPALLIAGTVWFGWDGFVTSDPDMLEHQTFNRIGFGILALAASYYGWRGVKEFLADRSGRESGASSQDGDR